MLYIVATPIGNLEDITLRALRVLKEADFIAAEDTRRTVKLLNHYNIKTKLVSFHEHSNPAKRAFILEELRNGKDVALVSDAGTPLISDPGAILVSEAIAQGITVTSLPGACAAITALTLSGITGHFIFIGFLPKKAGDRKRQVMDLAQNEIPCVIYESPRMVHKTLEDLRDACSAQRKITVARELTKLHEEVFSGTLDEACERFDTEARGEFVLVLDGFKDVKNVADDEIKAAIDRYVATGMTKKDAAKAASQSLGISKNRAYRLTV